MNELMVDWGLPPAKARVVAILNVAVFVMAEESEKEILCPLFTDLKIAIGKDEI